MSFDALFKAVHDGRVPFRWQSRLAEKVAAEGWPELIDVPTGCGKTAVIDIAIADLVRQLIAGGPRTAPLRIVFVVNRRVVVDDAYTKALKLARALREGEGDALKSAREALLSVAGEGEPPLAVSRLRGGVPLETDWVRTPAQPAVVVSTVDQVGSRLLFRGYGTSPGMAPVHAGLLGCDAHVLLDEAHLAEPFRQSVQALGEIEPAGFGPSLTILTATPGVRSERPFVLEEHERRESLIAKRLSRPKRAVLIESSSRQDADGFARALADHAVRLGGDASSVGVVVNRVATARRVHALLAGAEPGSVLLVIGRARALDRDRIAERLAGLLVDAKPLEGAPKYVVATQCLEAGADLDFGALVTQLAPIDALRQRFGRCNRSGTLDAAHAVVVAGKDDLSKKGVPIYGTRSASTWDLLREIAGDGDVVDFGAEAMEVALARFDDERLREARSDPPDAPVLMPAYLDLWSRTWPRPEPSPDVPMFLHGVETPYAEVTVLWRAEAEGPRAAGDRTLIDSLVHARPRSAETMTLSVPVVRSWLSGARVLVVADVPNDAPEAEPAAGAVRRRAFRWRGPDRAGNEWIDPSRIRSGDVLVLPPSYGGCDEFGFDPDSRMRVTDLGHDAAWPYRGHGLSVRVSPALMHTELTDGTAGVEEDVPDALARCWQEFWSPVGAGAVPTREELVVAARRTLNVLGRDAGENGSAFVRALGLLAADDGVEARVFTPLTSRSLVALRLTKIRGGEASDALPITDDDALSSASSVPVTISRHGEDVRERVERYAERLQLSDGLRRDLGLAAELHDIGKADLRFQQRLAGNALGGLAALRGESLAKGIESAFGAGRGDDASLPRAWRHEALSVRMALHDERLREAQDSALVVYLIGTHHGYGRPWFPHDDDADDAPRKLGRIGGRSRELESGSGPQRLGFRFPALNRADDTEHEGLDWPQLFELLNRRYGHYGLARLEAVLRLADHRVSGGYA